MRVLAAMSGGVDSAVAAARAVDAGHDVTGVHLALARNPQTYRTGARGCCTLEDSRDARRAADVIGIPFYVWDMAERFHADVVDDFVAEYAAGRTPNPCLRCNEKIKFAAVLDRALALGLRRGGHRPPRPARRGRPAAPQRRPGQGPVVRAGGAHPRRSWTASMFPLGDSTKAQVRAEAARARPGRRRQARLARHLLHRRRRHPRLPAPSGSARRPATSSTRPPARWSGSTTARTRTPSASGAGCTWTGPRPDGRPALRAVDHAGDQHGDRRPGRGARGVHRGRRPSGVDRRRAADGAGRVRGAAAGARRRRCRPSVDASTATG